MKSRYLLTVEEYEASILARGSWIEIYLPQKMDAITWSILARGSWIEIQRLEKRDSGSMCRSSQEGRGLKFKGVDVEEGEVMSILARGSWIEIGY